MNCITKYCVSLVLISGLLLIVGACSKKEETPKVEKKTEVIPPQEVVIVPTLSDEVFFEEVHNKLQDKGFTISEPLHANVEMFRAETGITLVVNGESLLPLHIYKLAPTDDRLSNVDETGSIEVSLGSKREPLAVKRMENFIIYLHKAHPDFEKIMETVQ
ncbi:hypothetical protein ORD22_07540 [Sporosarcina sp. GW1-11]|uniref:hypothetical protein n=1 Tax=Sporosarcina sp. GW1-11 TaxID=2899126 RepID=UPI00294BD062|nr:hypothetical protein [Sporosarcina sp. GW1-11]MDV6378103.1 hypothetical protein [Sporosarcina sp. GW1-11]